MKKLRLFVASFALLVGVGGFVPVLVSAETAKSTVCQSLGSNAGCTTDPNGSVSLNKVIKTVVNVLSLVVGLVAVIMVIVGGFKMITSGGDSNKLSSGRNTVLYAIVGLVVVATAQFIVQFVLNRLK